MAERDLYTADQLAKIRATLEESLGEASGGALENLDSRFTAKEDGGENGGAGAAEKAKKKEKAKEKAAEDKEAANLQIVLEENKLKNMVEAVPDFKDHTEDVHTLVGAILKHKDLKAFHLVDCLSKIKKDDIDLIDALVDGITSRKGINPLIDALRHSTESPKAVKALAMAIAEQGSSNHLIRAIATAPNGQKEAETIWAMEIMGKGSMEQLLEAMKLLDDNSPGIVILAVGLTNRKEVAIEPLVRALAASADNPKACTILSVALTKLTDQQQLVTLLEKYVTDDTEAAEILIAKLVLRSSKRNDDGITLPKACSFMRGESLAGKILAMGIIEQCNGAQLEKSFNRLKSHAAGQKMVVVAIKNKLGGMKAMKLLGGLFFKVGKFEDEARASTSEAKKRYQQIVKEVFKESLK
jgi:hypothetical protein